MGRPDFPSSIMDFQERFATEAACLEYLAASRCIVTEPLKYQLPVSLIEGKNYLSFRTPEECVGACERLLSDPEFADQMRYENHKYYLNEVEPSVLVYRCLETAMSL